MAKKIVALDVLIGILKQVYNKTKEYTKNQISIEVKILRSLITTNSNDIKTLKEVCGKDVVLKVILETCLLTDEEIVKASELSKAAGADFVKTSTGFSTAGAKAKDVALMRKTVGEEMGVKASGGIHTAKEAQEMIDAGASRLGTSATLAIIGA